jgi:hypothetical protein
MAKKRSSDKGVEFKIFLKSLTLTKIKESINHYNQFNVKENCEDKKLKGYSSLRNNKLVDFINSSLGENNK